MISDRVNRSTGLALAVILIIALTGMSTAQTTVMKDGVTTIINERTGLWKDTPKVSLKLTGHIGDIESEDDNLLFYLPKDIVVDTEGNRYILDAGNHRIQKFSSDGKYLMTIGRKGNGPGEFSEPVSLDVDPDGNIYVPDLLNRLMHVFSPDGKTLKSYRDKHTLGTVKVLPGGSLHVSGINSKMAERIRNPESVQEVTLISVFDRDGNELQSFGTIHETGNPASDFMINDFISAVDGSGNTVIAFNNLNRIEKYSPQGDLIFRMERPLNYKIVIPEMKAQQRSGSGGQQMMFLSSGDEKDPVDVCRGVAADSQGRIWVVTAKRQLEEEENVQLGMVVSSDNGQISMSKSLEGDTGIRETDAYEIEIFNSKGILLGRLPLNHFCDGIKIYDDRLFVIDQLRGMQVYEYQIIDQ